ncbi:MAG: 30S ribosomal protein S14 [Gammaproteobacteria bacterium]|nr:30S ribosomal protein S14 [Gammaproteobacteria bacterium]|tara:strand:- start:227 stop:532 length:306 start_codon:yes stop_codon:yes gene_type:complete
MTRASIIEREKKREKLIAKYAKKRNEIKEQLKKTNLDMNTIKELRTKLQKLPTNSIPIRKRNRCSLTGRPRGVYRKFALGRTKLREIAMKGDIPGLTKASW